MILKNKKQDQILNNGKYAALIGSHGRCTVRIGNGIVELLEVSAYPGYCTPKESADRQVGC